MAAAARRPRDSTDPLLRPPPRPTAPLNAFEILVDWPHPPSLHIHERQLEFFACLDGRGRQYLDQQVFPAAAGELYLMPAGHPHLSSGIGRGLRGLVLNATAEGIPGGSHELGTIIADLVTQVRRIGPRLPLSAAGFRTVVAALGRIVAETRERRPGHLAAAMLAYGELLVAIRRDPLAEAIPFRHRPEPASERIHHLCRWLGEAFRGEVSTARMVELSGLSRTTLHAAFHEVTGTTPRVYLERLRLDEAERLLRESEASVTDIALGSGFGSLSQFYAAFQRRTGMAPQRWRGSVPAPS